MKNYVREIVFLLLLSTVCIYMSGIMNTSYRPNASIKSLSSLIYNNDKTQLPWWDGGECSNRSPIIYHEPVTGHCGVRASALGPGQKVVSMCIYGKSMVYYKGIEGNLKRIKEVYPGYKLRLYLDPRINKDHLCPLMMKYEHLYICDITNLPGGLGNISHINPRGWRFSVMGDPQVDVILVRDSEVTILDREVSAVDEWLESKTTLHVMKDIPRSNGGHPIMAGCWGLRQDLGKSYEVDMKLKLNILRELMFNYMKNKLKYWNDQAALKQYLYPILQNDMVRHDSYFCKKYPGSRPFPTQRNGTKSFVGQCFYGSQPPRRFSSLKCPVDCRPLNHQDWEYC